MHTKHPYQIIAFLFEKVSYSSWSKICLKVCVQKVSKSRFQIKLPPCCINEGDDRQKMSHK